MLQRNKSLSAPSTTKKNETQKKINISDTPEDESTDSIDAYYAISETSQKVMRDVQRIEKKRLGNVQSIILGEKCESESLFLVETGRILVHGGKTRNLSANFLHDLQQTKSVLSLKTLQKS